MLLVREILSFVSFSQLLPDRIINLLAVVKDGEERVVAKTSQQTLLGDNIWKLILALNAAVQVLKLIQINLITALIAY